MDIMDTTQGRARKRVRSAGFVPVLIATAFLGSACGTSGPGADAKPAPSSSRVTTSSAAPVPSASSAVPTPSDLTIASTPPSSSAENTTACPEPGVRIAGGPVSAAMGLRAMSISMTNCGTRPYEVNGYPGLRVLDDKREPLAVRTVDSSSIASDIKDPGARPLTLRPGERAIAMLVWRNTVDSITEPANGEFLEVTPAKGRPPQVVKELIDVGTTGKLGATAWKRPEKER
ncbi:DUF4232 domain-containing protein [Streptomyces sp. NPDC003077]|uniref:DUF4232 domain-containing protein n=1 Tax=Streptomyces sp. NPDC003077 TaxID=3154443 RepID=UPI0033AB3590